MHMLISVGDTCCMAVSQSADCAAATAPTVNITIQKYFTTVTHCQYATNEYVAVCTEWCCFWHLCCISSLQDNVRQYLLMQKDTELHHAFRPCKYY